MRHLRTWRWRNRPTGLFLVRAVPVLCGLTVLVIYGAFLRHVGVPFVYAGYRAYRGPLYCPQVLRELEGQDGRQLAIVHYQPDHDPRDEWVYNAADIDGEKVVWARDMGPSEDQELIRYFKGRRVWLVEPDEPPPKVSPYP